MTGNFLAEPGLIHVPLDHTQHIRRIKGLVGKFFAVAAPVDFLIIGNARRLNMGIDLFFRCVVSGHFMKFAALLVQRYPAMFSSKAYLQSDSFNFIQRYLIAAPII